MDTKESRIDYGIKDTHNHTINMIINMVFNRCNKHSSNEDYYQEARGTQCSSQTWLCSHYSNKVESEDFVFRGQLATPRPTNNFLGSTVTPASVLQFPALNIQGVSLARIDFGPRGGLNPPHVHPRASELNLVLEGTILAGFVTTNQFGNRFFSSILKPGDAIIFPQGLLHFEFNMGDTPGVAFASFSSQNPGVLTLANASFGSDPRIPVDVLARAYNLDPRIVVKLEEFFMPSPIAEGAA